MQYFAEIKLFEGFEIILGIENGYVIFSHHFSSTRQKEEMLKLEKKYFPNLREDKNKLKPFINKLENFRQESFDPVETEVNFSRGTSFQKKVWQTLRKVNRGEVISYKGLAEKSGHPGAQRAVGNAMSNNYLLLFVPCHRVIASNQKIGGFSAGIQNKKKLLKLESYKDQL